MLSNRKYIGSNGFQAHLINKGHDLANKQKPGIMVLSRVIIVAILQ